MLIKHRLLNMLYLNTVKYNQIFNSKETAFLKGKPQIPFNYTILRCCTFNPLNFNNPSPITNEN